MIFLIGIWSNVEVIIDGVTNMANFEVIEIIDDTDP